MGSIRMGPPEELILALRQRGGLDHFVETGTFRGRTAAWAAAHFGQVTTIEMSGAIHAAFRDRFGSLTNVRAVAGDSRAVLGEVVAELAQPAIFWLDAHWSGLDTAGGEAECPVLEEIARINASPQAHIVLVDDARLFCAPPPRPHRAEQWPDLASIAEALAAGGRRYLALFEDAFVAVPSQERQFLTGWLQDHATEAASRSGGRVAALWRSLTSWTARCPLDAAEKRPRQLPRERGPSSMILVGFVTRRNPHPLHADTKHLRGRIRGCARGSIPRAPLAAMVGAAARLRGLRPPVAPVPGRRARRRGRTVRALHDQFVSHRAGEHRHHLV